MDRRWRPYIITAGVFLLFILFVLLTGGVSALAGYFRYSPFFFIFAGISAIIALGLNIQWGFTGLFNLGVAGFFAVGAYTSAILTTASSPNYLGGFSLPFLIGVLGGGVVAGLLALLIGIPTLRLRDDYLAIATIGVAEIIRLVISREAWLTHGTRGIGSIPRPLHGVIPFEYNFFYLFVVIAFLVVIYFAIEKGIRSPWGRVLKGIREDEDATQALGKDVRNFKLQSLVLGSIIMGVAGALYAHFYGFISPEGEAFRPIRTFIIWVMLISGGSGNNKGAILGAFVIWGIWSGSEILTGYLPAAIQIQASAIRVILIGVFLEIILLTRPQGLLGEEKHISKLGQKQDKARELMT